MGLYSLKFLYHNNNNNIFISYIKYTNIIIKYTNIFQVFENLYDIICKWVYIL